MMELISLTQNQTMKLNTYTKAQSIEKCHPANPTIHRIKKKRKNISRSSAPLLKSIAKFWL